MAPSRSGNREKNNVTAREGDAETVALGKECPGLVHGAIGEGPVDLWTSPSGRPAPCGACGQAVDDARASPTALTTLAGSRPQAPQDSNNNPLDMNLKGDGKKGLTE